MEYTATIHHGSIRFEISGSDGEEIREEVLALISFVDEHADQFEPLRQAEDLARNPDSVDDSISGQREIRVSSTNQRGLEGLSSVADRTGVDYEFLIQLFEIPDDEDEVPFLRLFDFDRGVDLLGNYRSQQQAQGAVLLLYIWKVCRGVEDVELEQLDQALSYSDIDIERRDAMYSAFGNDAGNWLNSDGNRIELTTRGEHKAREIIRELIEEVGS